MSQLGDLIRSTIAAKSGRVVFLEEWNLELLITGLPASARLEASKMTKGGEVDPVEFTALAISRAVRDPKTKALVFSKEEALNLLDSDTTGACDKLLKIVLELSGLLPGSVEKAKADFLGMPNSATPLS